MICHGCQRPIQEGETIYLHGGVYCQECRDPTKVKPAPGTQGKTNVATRFSMERIDKSAPIWVIALTLTILGVLLVIVPAWIGGAFCP